VRVDKSTRLEVDVDAEIISPLRDYFTRIDEDCRNNKVLCLPVMCRDRHPIAHWCATGEVSQLARTASIVHTFGETGRGPWEQRVILRGDKFFHHREAVPVDVPVSDIPQITHDTWRSSK
jgi:hypothetical protein